MGERARNITRSPEERRANHDRYPVGTLRHSDGWIIVVLPGTPEMGAVGGWLSGGFTGVVAEDFNIVGTEPYTGTLTPEQEAMKAQMLLFGEVVTQ